MSKTKQQLVLNRTNYMHIHTYQKTVKRNIIIFFTVSFLLFVCVLVSVLVKKPIVSEPVKVNLKPLEVITYKLYSKTYVTGYNSFESQTDGSPCVGAGGYICGKKDVTTCPREIPLGTQVKIGETIYTCLDRTNKKYDSRFDIFCDKDTSCPSKVTGHKNVYLVLVDN